MDINTLIKLRTYLGTIKPPNKISEKENYWKLIGKKGIVKEEAYFDSNKVLVIFENNLDDFGLENHNDIENSLYINKQDLEIVSEL